jgi:hypothetical protein
VLAWNRRALISNGSKSLNCCLRASAQAGSVPVSARTQGGCQVGFWTGRPTALLTPFVLGSAMTGGFLVMSAAPAFYSLLAFRPAVKSAPRVEEAPLTPTAASEIPLPGSRGTAAEAAQDVPDDRKAAEAIAAPNTRRPTTSSRSPKSAKSRARNSQERARGRISEGKAARRVRSAYGDGSANASTAAE